MYTNQTVPTLQIQMLGGFHIIWKDKPVLLGKNLSNKMLHLLLLLVYSRNEGIRRERLLEQLYGDTDIDQASNSLRAIVYRLRKSLIAAGLPDGEYITTRSGIYRWQAEHIQLELDAEEFQKQTIIALEELDPAKAIPLLQEACRMYRGEFLPMMTSTDWVATASWRYQELYFKCLRELARLLMAQERYSELMTYCERALTRYPYEEWQIMKLECLTAMKEYKKAMEYYEQVAAEYQREFGLMPSEELTRRYRNVRNMIQFEMNNLNKIQDHIQPDTSLYGATGCDYLTFVDIYRYMVWVLERNNINAYLMLLTLTDQASIPLEAPNLLEEARQALEKSIQKSARRSDLYARYGKNQFLVLLAGTDRIGCECVSNRIRSSFNSLCRRRKITIYVTYHPAHEIPESAFLQTGNISLSLKE